MLTPAMKKRASKDDDVKDDDADRDDGRGDIAHGGVGDDSASRDDNAVVAPVAHLTFMEQIKRLPTLGNMSDAGFENAPNPWFGECRRCNQTVHTFVYLEGHHRTMTTFAWLIDPNLYSSNIFMASVGARKRERNTWSGVHADEKPSKFTVVVEYVMVRSMALLQHTYLKSRSSAEFPTLTRILEFTIIFYISTSLRYIDSVQYNVAASLSSTS
jgi:hypothetical protein